MANGRTMDVVAIELEERPPGALFFEAAHFEAAATVILGGAHDTVATMAAAVDLKKALRHSLLLESPRSSRPRILFSWAPTYTY